MRIPWAAIIGIVGLVTVGATRAPLATEVHGVKMRDDVYPFPPPREMKAASLGYHAALSDYLWSKLLVEYGTHWAERRAFLDGPKYIDAILELSPDHPLVYKYVDTLLVYRPPSGGDEADARRARAYLERGTRERPNDYKVWLEYGQFTAYLGPSWLKSDTEREQWRHDGALALLRAVELGADPFNVINATTTLKRFGERDAAIRQLERAYALTDDDKTREQILQRLSALQADQIRDETKRSMHVVEDMWRREYPFVSRTAYLVTGPMPAPLACAGRPRDAAAARACAHDWSDHVPSVSAPTD